MTTEKAIEVLDAHAELMDVLGEVGREVAESCLLAAQALRKLTPRPIKYAPKDGTHILAVAEDKEWTVVYYSPNHSRPEKQWRIHRSDGTHLSNPTHWLPLPKLPEVRQ